MQKKKLLGLLRNQIFNQEDFFFGGGGRGCKAIWRIVRTSEKILATPLEECGDQVNLESQSDESAKGESSLADELCKVISKT